MNVRLATARVVRGRRIAVATLGLSAAFGWGLYQLAGTVSALAGAHRSYLWVGPAAGLLTLWQLVLCQYERPSAGRSLSDLSVAALVPVYNEDPTILRGCLDSLLMQTLPPRWVCVVDDGSTEASYEDVRDWFLAASYAVGVEGHWLRQDNAGKRFAQAAAACRAPEAQIYLTVDSDSMLDQVAVAEGLAPFTDPHVQSVAGTVLSANSQHNLLTRIADLWTVSTQLVERSAASRLGSVFVNCGGLAFYRAPVLWDNLDAYLNETFLGHRVGFSDDSMLTLFALVRGRTVTQPTAFAFCVMPTTLSHHLRQQLRWLRGSFIRSWWRLRYLPLNRTGYWLQLAKWLQFALTTASFVAVIAMLSRTSGATAGWLLFTHIVLYYLVTLRYLAIRRTDLNWRAQLANYLLAPLAGLWFTTVIRALRWYAMATAHNTGWGTRDHIEVYGDTNRISGPDSGDPVVPPSQVGADTVAQPPSKSAAPTDDLPTVPAHTASSHLPPSDGW